MKTLSPDDLRALSDRDADPADRQRALSRLAHWEVGKYAHLETTIVSLLDDEDAMVRGAAYKTLLAWKLDQYLTRAADALKNDTESDVRQDVAFALARYAVATRKDVPRILGWLVDALDIDEDVYVQREIYEGILKILAPDRDAPETENFDRVRDVDWKLLAPYRNKS